MCGDKEQELEQKPIRDRIDGPPARCGGARRGPGKLDRCLLLEIAVALMAAVFGIKAVSLSGPSAVGWLLGPAILIGVAFLAVTIAGRDFVQFGLSTGRIVASLAVLGCTCVVVFPLVFGGLWVLKSYELGPPLPAALPQEQGWPAWVFYQFMYVALAEEVFFRGYILSSVQKLLEPFVGLWPRTKDWASIAISAGCFALAHVVVQGQIVSLMTFWPGLVLGWLFIRTGSLLAPILFHGLANLCYVVMAGVFA